MRRIALLTAAAVAAATMTATARPATTTATRSLWQQKTSLRSGIAWHRSMTWHYQDRAGVPRTRTEYAERHVRSVAFLRWDDRLWSRRHIAARHLAASHPAVAHLSLWLCIHAGEGSWTDEDSGGNGHYGGLQMTLGWDGLVKDAAKLTPYEQMSAAETGYRRSGYSLSWLNEQWGADARCFGLA